MPSCLEGLTTWLEELINQDSDAQAVGKQKAAARCFDRQWQKAGLHNIVTVLLLVRHFCGCCLTAGSSSPLHPHSSLKVRRGWLSALGLVRAAAQRRKQALVCCMQLLASVSKRGITRHAWAPSRHSCNRARRQHAQPLLPSPSCCLLLLWFCCERAEYVLEFQKCLDRTDPVPFSTIRGIIQQELKGRSVESVFSYIDPQPLASASVAQVSSRGVCVQPERLPVRVYLRSARRHVVAAGCVQLGFMQPHLSHLALQPPM